MLKINGIKNTSFNFASNSIKHTEKPAEPQPSDIKFGADDVQNAEEPKTKKFGVKKLTNILGVAMWIAIAAIGMHKTKLWDGLTNFTPEAISRNSEKAAKKIRTAIDMIGKADDKTEAFKIINGSNASKLKKWWQKRMYGMGNFAKKAQDVLGTELYNNLTYAFGTLVVMPLVIWFSPIGKKDATWEDNFTASIRQPFSVFATLTMQGVFDKLFDKYTGKAIKNNVLENDVVKNSADKNGKIALEAFGEIKYNSDEAKRLFELLPTLETDKGGLKGILTTEQVKEILNLNALADKKDGRAYIEHLNELRKDGILRDLSEENFKIVQNRLEVFTKSLGLNKLAKQKPKVVNNVIVSSIIGCTFLNVIYGKFMKSWHEHRDAKAALKLEAENQLKEVA